jgi:hypothetical protein
MLFSLNKSSENRNQTNSKTRFYLSLRGNEMKRNIRSFERRQSAGVDRNELLVLNFTPEKI